MKRGLKKAVTALMITAIFTLTGSVSSQAMKIPIHSGQALQETWVQLQNIWYYQNENGEVHTGWLEENGTWYYLDSEGAMYSGWLNLDGTWYYLDTDGKMLTGWLNLDNSRYYLEPDGKMATGWLNQDESWYYLDADGKMVTDWLDLDGSWYYLKPDGKMATGWLNLDDSWYYLNSDGKMATDWLNLNDSWYYLNPDGKMAADTWIAFHYVDANGVWIENQVPDQNLVNSTDSFTYTESEIESTESVDFIESAEPESVESESEEATESTELVEEETVPDHMGSEKPAITPEYIVERLEHLRIKYPDGMYWNHMGYTAKQKDTNYYSETVTSIPCKHGQYGTDYCNAYINYSLAYVIGMQCDGFARKLSDEIFGTDAGKTDYAYQFDAVKVGDYLRYNNAHTVLVIGKDASGIQVAECNIGGTCVIRWGRRITREDLDRSRSVICFTRY